MATETFFRVHWDGCAPFSAANAWSPSNWGLDRSADCSQEECTGCWGGGSGDYDDHGNELACRICDDTGWADCRRGYSCCSSPEDLIAYMRAHVWPDETETVVEFEGVPTGESGWDGEDLAVPGKVVKTWSWAEFTAHLAVQEQAA